VTAAVLQMIEVRASSVSCVCPNLPPVSSSGPAGESGASGFLVGKFDEKTIEKPFRMPVNTASG